jgi:hypothetical protein
MPKRKRKIGRPRLSKRDAKGVIVNARVSPQEARAYRTAARVAKLRPSAWMRSTLNAACQG